MATAEDIRAHGAGEKHGDFYPRLGHRNGRVFESHVANLEQTDGAVAFSSGMAAIHAAILAHCGNGDRLLLANHIYGGTANLARDDLPRFGIQVERFDALDLRSLEQALATVARMVVLETPINPTLRLVDLRRAAEICHQNDALLLVDATFAPPPIQQTASLGVDLTVHSATKYLGGHSDVLAGVVAGTHEVLAPVAAFRSHTGGILGPDAAWLLCRSMPTLPLRLAAQQAAAGEVARGLLAAKAEGAPLLSVSYPGLPEHQDHGLMREQMSGGGCLVTLEVAGGLDRAQVVFDALEVLNGAAVSGDRTAVIGGGLVGCETAQYLVARGKRVTIVEMLEQIAADIPVTTRSAVTENLKEAGIRTEVSARAIEFTEEGVVVERDGETFVVRAEAAVLAVGQKPKQDLAEKLEGRVKEIHVVGDCAGVRRMRDAIHEGARAGLEI